MNSFFERIDDEMLERYSRQIIIDEIAEKGQLTLKNSSVLIVGLGGLGSPASLYLAASGVGRIGLCDYDQVELANLQRQIIYTDEDIGRSKVFSAVERLSGLNSNIKIETFSQRLTPDNIDQMISSYDIILDACDNFETRSILNEICVKQRKILISAALTRFEGQITVFATHLGTPCYHCLYPQRDVPNHISRCDLVGVFSPIAGLLGVLMASEALKMLLNIGTHLCSRLLLVDLYGLRFEHINVKPDPNCHICRY
ncbi:MAG: HesA/MoeB/ThiF family protein [Pseudomonadota bacterium]